MTPECNDEELTNSPTDAVEQIDYEEAIEAILFAAGHPITYENLAKTFEIPVSELKQIVFEYQKKYNSSRLHRGVTLITFDSCCQLCTKPQYISLIRTALGIRKSSGTLSASTIEALTIVAYQQPVTRAYVDAVRNADSSYAMTNLLDRGLIEPKGRKDVPGRPILYGTTNAFLRCFGLNSLDDLPGSTGEAQNVFRSINSRIKPEENGSAEQMSMEIPDAAAEEQPQATETETDAQTPVPKADSSGDMQPKTDVPADDGDDEQEDWGNATEEAERTHN